MPDTGVAVEVVVSLQARGFEDDPGAGHLAAGVLGDPGVVLVPSPTDALLAAAGAFEALVIPLPLEANLQIERIDAWCMEVMLVDGAAGLAAAVIKLARPSRHPSAMAPFQGPKLAAALDGNGGDLWAALEGLGIVREGLRDGPGADVFGRLPEIERAQRRPHVREHVLRAHGDIGFNICRWFCICDPGPPGPSETGSPVRRFLRPRRARDA
jgi:hypothetical protein